jgi:membrane protease YdiL (CAAX protease family)
MSDEMKNVNETDAEKQRVIKNVILITALCAAEVAATFVFKFVVSVGLGFWASYAIYIAMIAFVVIVCRIEKRRVADLGFRKEKLSIQILVGVSIAAVLSFLIGALPILIGGSGASLIGPKQTNTGNIIYSIVTYLVFIGLVEELIFRGYIQTRINELTRHKFVGVLIAAALFGLWHIINGSWAQVAYTFLIGCVFGFCKEYVKNCSLLSLIIAHGLFDALLVVVGLILL